MDNDEYDRLHAKWRAWHDLCIRDQRPLYVSPEEYRELMAFGVECEHRDLLNSAMRFDPVWSAAHPRKGLKLITVTVIVHWDQPTIKAALSQPSGLGLRGG